MAEMQVDGGECDAIRKVMRCIKFTACVRAQSSFCTWRAQVIAGELHF